MVFQPIDAEEEDKFDASSVSSHPNTTEDKMPDTAPKNKNHFEDRDSSLSGRGSEAQMDASAGIGEENSALQDKEKELMDR